MVSNLRPKQTKVRLAGLSVLSFSWDGVTLLFLVQARSGRPHPWFWCSTLFCCPALPFGSLVNAWSHKHCKGTFKGSLPTQSKRDQTTLEPSLLWWSANDRVAVGPCSAVTASRSTGGFQEFLFCVCSHSCLPEWLGVTQDCMAVSAGRCAHFSPPFIQHQLLPTLNNTKRRERTISPYSPVNPLSGELRLLGTLSRNLPVQGPMGTQQLNCMYTAATSPGFPQVQKFSGNAGAMEALACAVWSSLIKLFRFQYKKPHLLEGISEYGF